MHYARAKLQRNENKKRNWQPNHRRRTPWRPSGQNQRPRSLTSTFSQAHEAATYVPPAFSIVPYLAQPEIANALNEENMTPEAKQALQTWRDDNPQTEVPSDSGRLPVGIWYKNGNVSMAIPFKNSRFIRKYRNVHEAGVQKMYQMYMGREYLPAHALTVRVIKEGMPDTYEIVDGLHRFFALQQIVNTYGESKLDACIYGRTVGCTVLKFDTPLETLTIIAESQNRANNENQEMTYLDSMVNLHCFAVACEKHYVEELRGAGWAKLTHEMIWERAQAVGHASIKKKWA